MTKEQAIKLINTGTWKIENMVLTRPGWSIRHVLGYGIEICCDTAGTKVFPVESHSRTAPNPDLLYIALRDKLEELGREEKVREEAAWATALLKEGIQ